MTSAIVSANVDGTYPVAGQDNSSQGFRDNFTAIKNNFTTAASEITTLQNHKAPTNATADFNGNVITRTVFKDTAETVYPEAVATNTDGAITINYENGHYHIYQITRDTTFTFLNWPATGTAGRIILDLDIIGDGSSADPTLTFPSAIIKASNVDGNDGTSDAINPVLRRVLYEFLTPNGGITVLMHQLGHHYI